MNDTQSLIGKILDSPQERDAIHIAVAPVVAVSNLEPGAHCGIDGTAKNPIGVVDPFLRGQVRRGQTFWLFLYPNTITALRHNWTHPAFASKPIVSTPDRSASETWMRAWAVQHTPGGYYDDEDGLPVDEEVAYALAINAGHEHSVGPYEDARDHIDNEWWTHWEAITGCRGQRGEYFNCSC